MKVRILLEREEDGRYIGEAPSRGILLYGDTRAEAIQKVRDTVLLMLADRIEHGEERAPASVTFVVNGLSKKRTSAALRSLSHVLAT
jgi:predicted RNase H-like HicB family nuclease